jgi:hypothetical protein
MDNLANDNVFLESFKNSAVIQHSSTLLDFPSSHNEQNGTEGTSN